MENYKGMGSKPPIVLSSDAEVKEKFREMITETTDSILQSFDNNDAYSGMDVYELRALIHSLGFLPEHGKGFEQTLDIVKKNIMPNLIRTWSPKYMPHLHSPALTETIASELIIGTFNDSMDTWDQGPAATEIEESMIQGLLKLFGFTPTTVSNTTDASHTPTPDGTFTSGGTQSNMAAIIAARDWYCKQHLGWDVKHKGLPDCYSKLRLYTSEVSHFSMEKTCHVMGLGYDAVRKVPVDARCKIDMVALREMIKADRAAGLIPFCAVATIGTTDYGSIDDVAPMREICDQYGMFLHADASYGSGLILSPTYRPRLGNLSIADSITVDFHKMFLLPISCSVVLFRDKTFQDCFQFHADYLNREEDEALGYINLVGKSLQTTRRFDALKVFMSFQTRGQDGFASIIDTVVENASYFYNRLTSDPFFYAPVQPEISSVVFAVNTTDQDNIAIRRHLLEEGIVIGQTTKDGRIMLKFTLLNPNLEHTYIDYLIDHIKQLAINHTRF